MDLRRAWWNRLHRLRITTRKIANVGLGVFWCAQVVGQIVVLNRMTSPDLQNTCRCLRTLEHFGTRCINRIRCATLIFALELGSCSMSGDAKGNDATVAPNSDETIIGDWGAVGTIDDNEAWIVVDEAPPASSQRSDNVEGAIKIGLCEALNDEGLLIQLVDRQLQAMPEQRRMQAEVAFCSSVLRGLLSAQAWALYLRIEELSSHRSAVIQVALVKWAYTRGRQARPPLPAAR